MVEKTRNSVRGQGRETLERGGAVGCAVGAESDGGAECWWSEFAECASVGGRGSSEQSEFIPQKVPTKSFCGSISVQIHQLILHHYQNEE